MKGKVDKWIKNLRLTRAMKLQVIGIICSGVILGIIFFIWDNQPLGASLSRNTYGAGNRNEKLQVEIEVDNVKGELELEISNQKLKKEDVGIMFDEIVQRLDKEILGDNKRYEEIITPLILPARIDDYPVQITWEWSPYELLNEKGIVQQGYVETQGNIIEVIGTLRYEDEEIKYVRNFMVYPEIKTREEQLLLQLQQQWDLNDVKNEESLEVQLPVEVNGNEVEWSRKLDYRGLWIVAMGGLIGILILFKRKQDLEKIKQERLHQMKQDYADIIRVFVLYIEAGMSIKNAWREIAYSGKPGRYAYEEMQATCNEMKNGIMEIEAYERFGRRTGSRNYERFSILLCQNIKKGTKGIGKALELEVYEAFEQRKRMTKQKGERAGTKLLMPMFIMLAVVLMIALIPALFSIQL